MHNSLQHPPTNTQSPCVPTPHRTTLYHTTPPTLHRCCAWACRCQDDEDGEGDEDEDGELDEEEIDLDTLDEGHPEEDGDGVYVFGCVHRMYAVGRGGIK